MPAHNQPMIIDFIESQSGCLNEQNMPEHFCRYLQQKFPDISFAVLKHFYSPWPYQISTPGIFAEQALQMLTGLDLKKYTFGREQSYCEIKDYFIFPLKDHQQRVACILLVARADAAARQVLISLTGQAQNLFKCLNNTAHLSALAAHRQCGAYINNITHDFNAMIAMISMLNVQNDSVQQKLLYGKKLTRDFLFYLSEPEMSRISLTVHDMLTAILLNFDTPIEIKDNCPSPREPLRLSVDLELINRALLAILENSVYYAGLVRGKTQINFNRLSNRSLFIPHDWVELNIINTGPAIPAEFLGKVNEPLFTTLKEQGQVGMGLALAEKIIQAHYGNLSISNIGTGGVQVKICLPLEEEYVKK
jgi:signal transduction histidine kinase